MKFQKPSLKLFDKRCIDRDKVAETNMLPSSEAGGIILSGSLMETQWAEKELQRDY